MPALPTILLIMAALSLGATVIAAIVAFRSSREANSAIFALIAPPTSEPAKEETAAEGQGSVAGIFENMAKTFKADAAAGVDVTQIAQMTLGVGDRDNPTPSGEGMLHFDDFRPTRPDAVPEPNAVP